MSCYLTGSPPKKRACPDPFASSDDYPDSDDSFNDPVLAEPSQITQAILQRRGVIPIAETRNSEGFSQPNTSVLSSPLRPPPSHDTTRKALSRAIANLTPRRFNAQEKSDYHHDGEVMMLKNRAENLIREKERAATAFRDQMIAKEKEHAGELSRRDERIRQLETQILALRQEYLQTSFQQHNASFSGTVDVEMADSASTPPPGPLLRTKKVNLLRNNVRWKAATRFGFGASVFGASSSIASGEENGSQTFAHIPSQMLTDKPTDLGIVPQLCPTSSAFITTTSIENKECQVSSVAEDWSIYGDGSQTRSFQYVDDLVDGLVLLMNSNCSLPVNLGNPEEHSIANFAQIIRDLVGSSSEIVHQPSQPDDPQQRKPDISRAARELNWKPQVSMRDGLRKTIEYFRDQINEHRRLSEEQREL